MHWGHIGIHPNSNNKDLNLPISCDILNAKEKEGNKKRMTDRKSYHREAIQASPPRTDAT